MPTCVSILIRASSVDYLMPICVSIFIQASSVDIPAKGSTKAQKKTEKSKQDKKGQSTSEHEVFAVYGTVFVYYWRHLRFSFPPFWLRSFSMPSSFFVTTFLVAVIFRWHLRSSMPSSFFDAIFVFRYHICSLPPFMLRSFFARIFIFRCHLHFSMPSSFFVFIFFFRYHLFAAIIFRWHLRFSMSSSFFDAIFVFHFHIFALPLFLLRSFFVSIFVFTNRICSSFHSACLSFHYSVRVSFSCH